MVPFLFEKLKGQVPPNTISFIEIFPEMQKTTIHYLSILQNVKETFCYLLPEEISQHTYSTDLPWKLF